jgi:hypothetical protein
MPFFSPADLLVWKKEQHFIRRAQEADGSYNYRPEQRGA